MILYFDKKPLILALNHSEASVHRLQRVAIGVVI